MPHPIIRRADHVGFAVGSLDGALRFWTEALGATLQRTTAMDGTFLGEVTGARGASARVAIVDLAGQTIELLHYADAPPRQGPSAAPFDPGTPHLALVVTDLDAVLARIAPHGWRPQGRPQTIPSGPRAGTRVVYAVGPDGETIEFMQPPEASDDGTAQLNAPSRPAEK